MINKNKMEHNIFKKCDIVVNLKNEKWLTKSIEYISSLKDNFGDNIKFYNEDKVIKVVLDGFTFNVSNRSEFLILKEIFIDGIYNFTINMDVIVFDIGMNVGFTSLFFANKKNIQTIYSFEPVKETYNDAIKNFEQNYMLSKKIYAYNQGLFSSNKLMEFTYNPDNKGSFGFVGNEKFKKHNNVFHKKKIQLFDVKQIIENQLKETELNYVIKIDCEGAEYDIIPEILKINRLPILFMIEWHLSKGYVLVDQLKMSGYTVIFTQTELTAGMIYAFYNKS